MRGGHDHNHAPSNFNAAFATGNALNIAFVSIEAFYGWKVSALRSVGASPALARAIVTRIARTPIAINTRFNTGLAIAWKGGVVGSEAGLTTDRQRCKCS